MCSEMKRKQLTGLLEAIQKNDFLAISDLMNAVEKNQFSREEVSKAIFSKSQSALKIGITGPPGAGKSSLMNKLIPLLRNQGLSIGVIAVDPSSPVSGGSFLGDRVRITNSMQDNQVFIRSMGSRAELGGVTELAEDFSDILAFSGKDIIFIETVGVGQSEYGVYEIADLTLFVFVPESGDEIQLLKAGILELADVFVVNKSDRKDANLLVKSITNIMSSTKSNFSDIPIIKTSCKQEEGIDELSNFIASSFKSRFDNANIVARKKVRFERRIKSLVEKEILKEFWTDTRLKKFEEIISKDNKTISPYDLIKKIKDVK